MAKDSIPCPLCEGGALRPTEPKKGYGLVRWICDQKGDNPKCKGWAYGGHKKKGAGAPQKNVPVPELQRKAKSEPGGEGNPGGRPEPKPEPKRGLLDRILDTRIF